jgi:hypothetical protein
MAYRLRFFLKLKCTRWIDHKMRSPQSLSRAVQRLTRFVSTRLGIPKVACTVVYLIIRNDCQ